VSHRLRLLALERDMLPEPHAHHFLLSRTSSRPQPTVVGDATLRAKLELIVHGDTTEWVNNRSKPLAACFVLRMEIENLGSEARSLKKPEIVVERSFPVSRWYASGSDGAPWNGELAGHEKKSVHVIGYVGEPLSPGARVAATIRFESLVLQTTARARARWNAE